MAEGPVRAFLVNWVNDRAVRRAAAMAVDTEDVKV
jgi:hypothetical protein